MFGLDFTKNQKLALCAIIGLCIIALSISYTRNRSAISTGDVVFRESGHDGVTHIITPDSDSVPVADQNGNSTKVIFQVTGHVKAPGVYSLPAGERIFNAIKAAGGALSDADVQAINLAAKIEDGSRIYIPSIHETKQNHAQEWNSISTSSTTATASSASSSSNSPKASNVEKLTTPGKGVVHINAANIDELQRLPGVGPSTAQKIIDHRTQIGKFTSPDQLLDVKGIGPKKFEKMRPFINL